jgi:hypothetical protein
MHAPRFRVGVRVRLLPGQELGDDSGQDRDDHREDRGRDHWPKSSGPKGPAGAGFVEQFVSPGEFLEVVRLVVEPRGVIGW